MSVPDAEEARRVRLRLREAQLDHLRAEALYLSRERDRLTHSVAGSLYAFLRPIERRIANVLARFGYFVPESAPEPAAPVEPSRIISVSHAGPARRLLIDVTNTAKKDAGTGIQRVVKEVARACHSGATFDIPAFAVRCENGRLYTANAFTASLGGVATGPDVEIHAEAGDRFLTLSDSWNAFDDLAPVLATIRETGGEIITCIFDLIPELHPYACHEITPPRYRAWLRSALLESDAFLAISRTVAEELAAYVRENELPHRAGLKIGWFQCGADLAAAPTATPRPKIAAAVEGDAPCFLIVGTIEPRKGHRVALRAFDRLWSQGADVRLVIVGRRGWFEEALVDEMTTHPEFGRRLFWFNDADDGELSYLYDHVRALILPSYAEGFGLPIVEAAQRGRAVICSDIPVFREVGRDGALYFRVTDAEALAGTIAEFLSGSRAADPARALNVSWVEASRRIVEVVAREDWLARLA